MNKKIDTSVIWNTKFYHCKIQASINFVQIMSTQVYFCGGGGGDCSVVLLNDVFVIFRFDHELSSLVRYNLGML